MQHFSRLAGRMLLLQSVKELKAEIDGMRSENEDMKKRLEVLEKIILTPEARAAAEVH